MTSIPTSLPDAIAPVAGFRFSALSAGIRKDGRIDLALVAADAPVSAAGLFTRNLVRAAPVALSSARVASGRARAVLVNSGCANACTGEPGRAAALATSRALSAALGAADDEVLLASTGVIGQVLPAARVVERADELVARLSPEGARDFATAILTTDRWAKVAEARVGGARVLGIAKGAGMIHPDLGVLHATSSATHATMLGFLLTDAEVDAGTLSRALEAAAGSSFNSMSVDGDTSTNDTLVALASGAARERPTEGDLAAALGDVCGRLARSMALDGEGAHHVVELLVSGLSDAHAARTVARTVATSLLVKTALHGNDANWGRLLAAAGRAGVLFDAEAASVRIAGVDIVRAGVALGGEAEAEAERRMREPTYVIELGLGTGPGRASYLTSDLGHGYVDVNASYRS